MKSALAIKKKTISTFCTHVKFKHGQKLYTVPLALSLLAFSLEQETLLVWHLWQALS